MVSQNSAGKKLDRCASTGVSLFVSVRGNKQVRARPPLLQSPPPNIKNTECGVLKKATAFI